MQIRTNKIYGCLFCVLNAKVLKRMKVRVKGLSRKMEIDCANTTKQ